MSPSQSVDDIVVTATRRSVDSQTVAATIAAVPAKTLTALGVTNVLQLTSLVPGLAVVPAGGNNVYLRGVGSNSSGYNDAQVAVYLDGLYLANPAMGIYSFNNIDQVEVLKGPQGTLYGRNVTAGLVAITTRDPGAGLRIDGSVGYANYDTFTQNFYASAPITDTLAANVSIYNSRQSAGWGKNLFTGSDAFKSRETGVEAKLLWQPAPATKVTGTFIFDTNNRDYGTDFAELPGTLAADGTAPAGRYNIQSRIDPKAPFRGYVGLLKIQQDLGFATLTSLSGYQESHQNQVFSANTAQLGQPVTGQGTTFADLLESNRTWSQEFQIASKASPSRLDWLGGLFYYRDDTSIAFSTYGTCVGGVCAPGAAPSTITGLPTTRSYSAFADVTYRVFTATHLTVGLRYTDETKGLSGQTVPLAGFPNSVAVLPASTVLYPGQPFAGSTGIPTRLHFGKLTYRIVLAQDLGANIHAYASDNLGFKAGAFNVNVFSNPPVEPEVLHAYEAGVKSEFFDRKLRLNAAYFFYDYTNVQLRSTAPPAPSGASLLQNVAAEHEKGVDVDVTLVPTSGLTINGGVEILDAKYTKFPGGSCSSVGPTKTVGGVLVGSVISTSCDLSGRNVAYAVPFSATLGVTYSHATPHGDVTVNANYHYNQRHTITTDGSIYAPAANLLDASILWEAPGKRYDLRLWAKNITNAYTYAVASVAANSFAYIPGAPRQFGATAGFHFR